MSRNWKQGLESILSGKYNSWLIKGVVGVGLVSCAMSIYSQQQDNYLADDVSPLGEEVSEIAPDSFDNAPATQDYIDEALDLPGGMDPYGLKDNGVDEDLARRCLFKDPKEYEVRRGDTLWGIASNFKNIGIEDIRSFNPGNLSNIQQGDIIRIPPSISDECIENADNNWKYIQGSSGEEVQEIRFNLGLENLGDVIGATKGYCNSDIDKNEFDNILHNAASYGENVSYEDLNFIAKIESNFGRRCMSNTGALGPFGLTSWLYGKNINMGDNNRRNGINPFNIEEASYRAAAYYDYLVERFDRRIEGIDIRERDREEVAKTLAMGAYNQGPSRINYHIRHVRDNPNRGIFDFSNTVPLEGRGYMNSYIENVLEQN